MRKQKMTDTRTEMISAAIDLFHRHGVNGTRVDQVLKKSGTGKSQFSHDFKTKEGMVCAAVGHPHVMIRSGQTPTGYNLKSWRDLESWFQRYIDFQEATDLERSCPIGTIGGDLAKNQKRARECVIEFLDWSRNAMKAFFSERIPEGEMVAQADALKLADFCISVMQGGTLLSKMRRDPEMFKNATAQTTKYISSLKKGP